MNSCMPRVDLIHDSELFFESNLLGINGTNDPKCFGKEPWRLEGLEMKNGGEKSRTPVCKALGATPPIAPQENIFP